MELVVFILFAGMALTGAVLLVTLHNLVRSVLAMILSFIGVAGLYLVLNAEFLAAIQVLVYVGAVMVLFLFVVMMLDINLEGVRAGFWRNLPLALVVGVIMVWELISVVAYHYFGTVPRQLPAGYSNTKELGRLLYTDYAYAFEIAAVILLVAIIAAIALTLRRRKDTRAQRPADQVRVRREERVRLVAMPVEKE